MQKDDFEKKRILYSREIFMPFAFFQKENKHG